jgi:hypothetical protein
MFVNPFPLLCIVEFGDSPMLTISFSLAMMATAALRLSLWSVRRGRPGPVVMARALIVPPARKGTLRIYDPAQAQAHSLY